MNPNHYEIRLCPSCGLRYPLTAGHSFGERCPACLGDTQAVLKREITPFPQREKEQGRTENLYILLDNIRSIWNVGSIFRTSDGLGVEKLYLCGITPTPQNETMRKTSLGSEESVAWEYSPDALKTAQKLKKEGYSLIALEQDKRAKSIEAMNELFPYKIVLVIGNEVTGVDPELLDLCDHIFYIPMHGQKHSFNVEVAFAIATYVMRSQLI